MRSKYVNPAVWLVHEQSDISRNVRSVGDLKLFVISNKNYNSWQNRSSKCIMNNLKKKSNHEQWSWWRNSISNDRTACGYIVTSHIFALVNCIPVKPYNKLLNAFDCLVCDSEISVRYLSSIDFTLAQYVINTLVSIEEDGKTDWQVERKEVRQRWRRTDRQASRESNWKLNHKQKAFPRIFYFTKSRFPIIMRYFPFPDSCEQLATWWDKNESYETNTRHKLRSTRGRPCSDSDEQIWR